MRSLRAGALLLALGCGSLTETEDGAAFLDVVRPPVTTLEVGATLQLVATARNARGEPVEAAITWRSADGFLAVDETTGLVTALAPGTGGRIQASTGTAPRRLVSDLILLTVVEPTIGPVP